MKNRAILSERIEPHRFNPFGYCSGRAARALPLLALLAGLIPAAADADTARGLQAFEAGNYAIAREEFEKSAAEGDGAAEYSLGVMQARGLAGFEKDMVSAAAWFTLADEHGFAQASHALGRIHHGGGLGTRDVPEAIRWFERASIGGHIEADLALASIFYRGDGVAQDFARSAKHIRRAAEAGVSTAQLHLGYILTQGHGVERSAAEAYFWLSVAMQNGLSEAAGMMAEIDKAELSTARRLEIETKANDFEPKLPETK